MFAGGFVAAGSFLATASAAAVCCLTRSASAFADGTVERLPTTRTVPFMPGWMSQ